MRLVGTLWVLASAVTAVASGPDLPNPFIFQRADPWITRDAEGVYYFTASVPAYDRIELRRSPRIEGLSEAEPRTIWRRHESGPIQRARGSGKEA